MEFIEAPAFTRHVNDYLDAEGYRLLQSHLCESPEDGDIIQGTGGFRKMRWPDARRNKGKRGGLRVIYFYFEMDEQIWLMTIYGKDEMDDLTPEQRRLLEQLIERECEARKSERGRSHGKA